MIFDLFSRASLNTPTTSISNPASWFMDATGVSGVYSGAKVSERTALNYSAYYACVKVLAETLATVPLKVYERQDKGRRESMTHPLWPIVRMRPNPLMSDFIFRELLVQHVVVWGNFYCDIEWSDNRRIASLWPLRPDVSSVYSKNGQKYLKTQVDGTEYHIPPGNFLHIAGMGSCGLEGYSPVRVFAAQAIGLGAAAEEFGAKYFGSGGRPPIVLTHPSQLSAEAQERMRNNYEKVHGGLRKSHRVMVLDEGVGIENIGIPNDDAQFLETRKFQVEEMARVHRIPQHKIGAMDKATFSNIEHQAIEFVTDAILPWATRIESECNHALFAAVDRGRYYLKHNLDGLLRGDQKTRSEAMAIKRQWGVISADEWRAMEEMNPLPDGVGEDYIVPLNYTTIEQLGDMEPVASASEPDQETKGEPSERRVAVSDTETRTRRSADSRNRLRQAQEPVLKRAAEHLVNAEVRAARRILKKAFKSEAAAAQFIRDMERFYEGFGDYVLREMLPVMLAFAEMLAGEVSIELDASIDMDPNLRAFVSKYAMQYGDRHVLESLRQLRKVISETPQEELENELHATLSRWGDDRPSGIAHNESVRMGSSVTKIIYGAGGVMTLKWVTVGDNCPLCTAMNGRTVSIQEPFLGSGETVDPKDGETAPLKVVKSIGHPPLHKGCNCLITPG